MLGPEMFIICLDLKRVIATGASTLGSVTMASRCNDIARQMEWVEQRAPVLPQLNLEGFGRSKVPLNHIR
jgi:hypothetical protein